MRKLNIFKLLLTSLIIMSACQSGNQKLPLSFTVTVKNQNDFPVKDGAVELSMKDIKVKYPKFNPEGCLVFDGNIQLPFQANDINGNFMRDELVFLVDLEAGETKDIIIRYKEQGMVMTHFKKRTQAELSRKFGGTWKDHKYIGGEFRNVSSLKVPPEATDHSFFIRYEGPGWESEKIGYRFYLDWRNSIDIFSKKTDTLILQDVGLDGYDSYHEPSDWGMDNFKVGNSFGIGSIAMWYNNKVNMVSVTDSVICRIALDGPVESMVETNYYGWKVGDDKYNLQSRLSIFAGSRMTRHDLQLNGKDALLCTGIIKHDSVDIMTNEGHDSQWIYYATWGKQTLFNDSIGLAVLVNRNDLVKITEDSLSHVLVLKPENSKLRYYFLAAWEKEKNGIRTKNEFLQYLKRVDEKLNKPLLASF